MRSKMTVEQKILAALYNHGPQTLEQLSDRVWDTWCGWSERRRQTVVANELGRLRSKRMVEFVDIRVDNGVIKTSQLTLRGQKLSRPAGT